MAKPFRVLLVDDEPALLEIGRLFLERTGVFSVETCDSAKDALDLLAGEPFEAIVSDYQMPVMDGIQLLALVRERYGRLPFILFTGRGREEIVIQAIDGGVDFYVQKGGDPKAQFAELAHKMQVAIERKATERTLAESERRFRALIQNSSDIIRIIDRDGRIAYDSDSCTRILGYAPGCTLGRSPLEFIHPDDRDRVRGALDEVYNGTNTGTPTEFRVRHADGHWIAVESVAANLIGTPGVNGVVTTTWPIEARRRAEEALVLSERRFRRAEEIAGIGHWEYHRESGILHASRGAQAIYGIESDQPALAQIQRMALTEYRSLLDRAIQDLVLLGRPYEVEFAIRRADDGRLRVLRSVAEYDPMRQTVFGILHDITEQRRTEDALRAGEERYRTLAEDMPVYVCTFLPDGTLTYVNPALAAMTGEPPEELLGRSFVDLLSPCNREIVKATIARLTPERPVDMHEQSYRVSDGTTRWQQWVHRAFFDPEGGLVRLQAVGLDITGLREAEASLYRANRALTLLSEITRHDIDNQLAVLRGYLSLARAEVKEPLLATYLERSLAAAEQIAALIRFAGAWGGMGARPPVWLDARATVGDAVREAASGAVHVENDLPADLRIWADPICVRVAAGLIENALRHGGPITTIRFTAEEMDDGGLALVCEDDGVGVPADAKERIFERGYGANTGLGLFLAREALGPTGITIAETGTPGEGARFELVVPPEGWRYRDGPELRDPVADAGP